MRYALWIAVLMFVLIIGVSLEVSSVKASVNPTATPTIGNPVYGFQIGYSSSSGASYLPRDGEICILKHNLNASYLGSLSPNKSMLVVKFTSDAYGPLTANYVDCELPVTYSLTDRFNWYLTQLNSSGYNLSNSDAYYVDGKTLQQVTLTIIPSLTSTITSTPVPTTTSTQVLGATSTSKPAPPATFVFYTGNSIDTLQYYAPRKNNICMTWNDLIGRIGPYFLPRGKSPLVIKFLEDQESQPMVVVWCEEAPNHTPAERLSSVIEDQPCCYSWNQGILMYVGANMQAVTLTPTPTITDTPSLTRTATATYTNTASSTRTATVTSTTTRTPTPVLIADKIVPINVSALHIPKAGDICYGQVVGNLGNKVVEFVADFQTGIEIRGGGCFTSKYYNLGQVLRYLESKGIRLGYESLPKPSLTPTRTLIPTATIVRFLAIGLSTTGTKSVLIEANTICWGAKVGNIEYKVVKFQRSLSTPLNITKGGCTYGQNLSAEDVFNYLRRVFNTPLRGFVDV